MRREFKSSVFTIRQKISFEINIYFILYHFKIYSREGQGECYYASVAFMIILASPSPLSNHTNTTYKSKLETFSTSQQSTRR